MNQLYSLEYEKALLASLLQSPDCILEIFVLRRNDFTEYNGLIFEIIKNIYQNKGHVSVLSVTEKAKVLNLKIEGIEIGDYVTSLSRLPVNLKEIKEIAKEIKKLSLIRHVIKNADELKQKVIDSKTDSATKIFEAIDSTLGKSLETFETSHDLPENVYDGLAGLIEERGNKPVEIVGYSTPYKTFNNYYGGLRKGQIYCIASRTGNGKSTWLQHLLDSTANECNKDLNIKALYLDTEMSKEDHMIRLAAMKTGCPYYLIDTGLWRRDVEWFPVMRSKLKELSENKKNNLYFKQVGSMGVKDLATFIKRWYYNFVGKGNDCIIAYDYLKILMADKVSSNISEWQMALDKLQILKDVIDEINTPLLTAIQVNRTGIVTNRSSSEVIDDESVISTSDRIGWLVALLAILRRKTPDEIQRDGEPFGSHKFVTLKSRFQGRISSGHHDLVKVFVNNKVQYKLNYVNFDIQNFGVSDKGSFRELCDLKGWSKVKVSSDKENAKDIEL